MPRYFIGKYRFHASQYLYMLDRYSYSNAADEKIKSYDDMLHQSLVKIFSEHCHNDSDQMKEFLRGLQHNTDRNSSIEPILQKEPILSGSFSKEEFGKLSLLWIAVLAGYTDSAELLVRSGADVNELFGYRDPQLIDAKWTILHLLLQMDPSPENERLIRLVTDHGADLQARDYKRRTVLHYAVRKERVQITDMLLEKGADVNIADNKGMTPLLVADNELWPLLMKHGADVFVKDRFGENALHYLASAPYTEQQVDLARVLIEMGVSLDDRNSEHQCQPIHLAVESENNELVKLFLDHGANVNAPAKRGESPLHVAARSSVGQTMLETLLERGANIDLRTHDGQTALHSACLYLKEENVRVLLSAGVDLLIQDNQGRTAFSLVARLHNMEKSGAWLIAKALATKKVNQPSIELKDERIMQRYPKLWSYYQGCIEEIGRMKATRFIETCAFFELLAKGQCQIAALMRNPEFEIEFRRYDLNNEFPNHADDLLRAFERARHHYSSMLEQENVINEAVYGVLPYVVVREVVRYIFNCCSENMK